MKTEVSENTVRIKGDLFGENRHIMVYVSKSDDNDHYNILLIKYGMDCLTSITKEFSYQNG